MTDEELEDYPEGSRKKKVGRSALQVAGGGIPYVGGIISAIASNWSERDQEKVNRFFRHWIEMRKEELREKEQTIVEIMARLDLQEAEISERIDSPECQSLESYLPAGYKSKDLENLIRLVADNDFWSRLDDEPKRELAEIATAIPTWE